MWYERRSSRWGSESRVKRCYTKCEALDVHFTDDFVNSAKPSPKWKSLFSGGQSNITIRPADQAIAQLTVGASEDKQYATFTLSHQAAIKYGFQSLTPPKPIPATADLVSPVLRTVALWSWHLRRTNGDHPFQPAVEVEFYKLRNVNPNRNTAGIFEPAGENLNIGGEAHIVVKDGEYYGFKIVNNTTRDLYAYPIYFSISDQSIIPKYNNVCGNGRVDPSLPHDQSPNDPTQPKWNYVTVGYGSDGVPPLHHLLGPNQDLDVGIYKIFLTTSPTDFSSLELHSPPELTRAMVVNKNFEDSLGSVPMWDTISMTAVQHRHPIPSGQGPAVTKDAAPANLGPVVTGHLSPSNIVSLLASWGCADLTSHLDFSRCPEYPIGGRPSNLYPSTLTSGTKTAIKAIRLTGVDGRPVGKYQKHAVKEFYTWSKCNHPNVTPLLGFAEFRGRLAIVSPWAEHGNITSYLANNPSADRCSLSANICKGLVYLHGNDIVHGDLKGANVLISGRGVPMLADFGIASLMDPAVWFTTATSAASFSLRWTAPEILRGTSQFSRAADVYALGMTILETLSDQPPFAGVADVQLLPAILKDNWIPKRPEAQIPLRSTGGNCLWMLLKSCWGQEPHLRPTAFYVAGMMSMITSGTLVYVEPLPVLDLESEAEDMDE